MGPLHDLLGSNEITGAVKMVELSDAQTLTVGAFCPPCRSEHDSGGAEDGAYFADRPHQPGFGLMGPSGTVVIPVELTAAIGGRP